MIKYNELETLSEWLDRHNINYNQLFPTQLDYSFLDGFTEDIAKLVAHELEENFSDLYVKSCPSVSLMQNHIQVALHSNAWGINKYYNAINVNYNPLENYDRTEHRVDTYADDVTSVAHGEVDTSTTSGAGHSEALTGVYGYNSSDSVNSDKVVTDVNSRTDSAHSDAYTDTTTRDGRVDEFDVNIHGNIGVTTSQQMLASELQIAMRNYHLYIARLIANDICIPMFD